MQPGDEVAGKYRVDRVLGAGAMGVVVGAWHIELEQEVAIKFLHPELAAKAESAERFRREARSAVRIPSEHVARVLDVGTLVGRNIPFIVMEYLRGRDLARLLAQRGPLPVALAVRFLLEACDAVGDAHARGIVHRDLKPANLFVVDRPGGGQMIKVLDFGISKTLSDGPRGLSITEPATLMGSPGYMSPEQLESSRNVDARTDIWSLGVILHEMVTGSLPFDGDSVPQLIRAVIAGQRAPLAEHLRELEPVLGHCLQQDRNARFQNIIELCDALLPHAREVPSVSHPVEPLPPAALASGAKVSTGPRVSSAGAKASSTGPRGSVPPAEGSAAREQTGAPDGPWGRTHGMRRSPLWRTLGLAAVLGAAGAAAFWRGHQAVQSLSRSSETGAPKEQETVEATPGLLPAPSPSPPSPPAPAVESTGAGGAVGAAGATNTPPRVSLVTPAAPPTSPPAAVSPPAPPRPAPPPQDPAPAPSPPPPPPAAVEAPKAAAPSAPSGVPSAEPEPAAPPPEYEQPGFGPRK